MAFEYLSKRRITDKTVPPGYTGTRKARNQGAFQFGHRVVQYSRPLSNSQIARYKLLPLSPEDPWIIENVMFGLGSDIRFATMKSDVWYSPISATRRLVVYMDRDFRWVIELRDLRGNVVGRPRLVRELESALQDIWLMLPAKHQAVLVKRVLPTDF